MGGVKKCQICGKRATMFLTQIVNSQMTELCLCEECAKERGLFDPRALTFAEKFFPEELRERVERIVRELSSAPGEEEETSQPDDVISQCPTCHFSLSDYIRTDRFGCPDCYSVFARELEHGGATSADGLEESPKEGDAAPQAPSRESLERRLREAVAREDYETAAKLRDQIKALS